MGDKYAGWAEEPADPHAGWTEEPVQPQEQPAEPSRMDRLVSYIKSTPGRIADTLTSTDTIPSAMTGATMDALPRLSAAIDTAPAALRKLAGGGGDLGDEYARNLRRVKPLYDGAVEREPVAHLVGAVAAPNPLSKAGAAGRVLGAAGAGALTSYMGVADVDDEAGKLDAAKRGGGTAALIQAGGEVVRPGLGKLGARYFQRANEIKAAKAAKDAEELLATRSGQYSQKVQDSNRAMLNIKEALADPNTSPELKARAAAFLSSPEGAALAEQVGANTLEQAPRKLAEMANLKALRAAAPADAAAQTADYFSKSTLREDVLPRVKNYASRAIPPLVADAAGSVMGGSKAVAAGALGAMTGAALGRPGTSLGNLMHKTPRFSAKLFDTLGTAANAASGVPITSSPAAAGKAGSLLEDYLRPKDDEERQEQGAAWFTSGSRR